MIYEKSIEGLSLKVGPLGESDRLITILSEQEGISRFAVPGARKPRSSLSAATPLTLLKLQVGGKSSLQRVRQIKVVRSYSKLGEKLETLSAAQAMAELSLMLVAASDPLPGILSAILIHLDRLEDTGSNPTKTLAQSIQACVHLLALGGYCLPLQKCCHSGLSLEPPLGEWNWRCSLFPEEGFAIGSFQNAKIQLNPSELALLQTLLKPNLPHRSNGDLLGPTHAWLKLLSVLESWINNHLPKNIHAFKILREVVTTQMVSDGLS